MQEVEIIRDFFEIIRLFCLVLGSINNGICIIFENRNRLGRFDTFKTWMYLLKSKKHDYTF